MLLVQVDPAVIVPPVVRAQEQLTSRQHRKRSGRPACRQGEQDSSHANTSFLRAKLKYRSGPESPRK